MIPDSEILFIRNIGVKGDVGTVILNRPRVLNVLNEKMCMALQHTLRQWQEDIRIKAVIIKGNGGKAFCAGGDIRAIYDNNLAEPFKSQAFFGHEYAMNRTLFHFTKPYIAFLDGITMGSGVGVSMHGSHRIATEHCAWAMPETTIGFFPDVGVSYGLSRLNDYMGFYLGLTGATITALAAYQCGLVSAVLTREQLPELETALLDTPFDGNPFHAVSAVIHKFFDINRIKANMHDELSLHRPLIATCFSKPSIEEIIKALNEADDPWAETCLNLLKTKSPTSLKVTLARLQQAQKMSFDDVIQQDLLISQHFLQSSDFFEGIRALLIDKDKNPHWQPACLSEVTPDKVAHFFTN